MQHPIGVKKLKENRIWIHVTLLLMVLAVLIWSLIKPDNYWIWFAEAIPALVILAFAIFKYKSFRLTTISYLIIAILSITMFIGAHYTYSKVPLFNWIQDEFNLKRNHYDRLGHFLKGLAAIIIREIIIRTTPISKGKWLITFILSISLAISALYEIIEWLAAVLAKGRGVSADFLGTQGDKWDAQWDMGLTLIGTIIALLLLSKIHDKLLRKEKI
jgi:putative membrane protein